MASDEGPVDPGTAKLMLFILADILIGSEYLICGASSMLKTLENDDLEL